MGHGLKPDSIDQVTANKQTSRSQIGEALAAQSRLGDDVVVTPVYT